MEERKPKSREEWKKIINTISPQGFQDLCYDLIRNNNFKNVRPRGGGADGGRDLEGEFSYSLPNKEEITDKCWFQCKRLKEGLGYGEISTEILQAEDQKIKKFFILSTSETTNPCKESIKNWNENHKCQVIDWSGSRFLDLLFEAPHICKTYFPDEEVPPLANINDPQHVIQLSSDLGKRFGIEIELNINKQININNPSEVAEALKDALLKLKDIEPNIKALVYEKISMFFFALEKYDDAIMLLNQSLDITPKNISALLNKAYVLEKTSEFDEANRCYDEILSIDSMNKFALNNKANNLRIQGEYEEALKLVNRALDIDHEFIVAIQNKATILKYLKKPEDALKFLDEKKGLVGKSLNLQITKVSMCIDLLDLKEAYKINEEILAKDPDYIDAINNKGVIYEKNSKFQKKEKYLNLALACFEEVIKKNEKYPLGWSNKVAIFINSGQSGKAEEIINFGYTLFPKEPHILNKKGYLLLEKNPKEALKYFDKALKYQVEEEFLLNKSTAKLNLKQWKEAKEIAEKLLKYSAENPEAWNAKGHALKHLHQTAKANICFKNAEKFKKKPISLLED